MKNKKIYNIGTNDAAYVVCPTVNGKQSMCPYYQTWHDMLKRSYSSAWHKKHPSYVGCSVVPEWHLFSNFKAWMEKQAWEGNQLDKDLLFPLNKVYSPETCVFVSGVINKFVTDRLRGRGEFPIGVYFKKSHESFVAQVSNPFTKQKGQEHLGYFVSQEDAHDAWLKRKLELARLLAAAQSDKRVAYAIIKRYENYTRNKNEVDE